MQGTIEAARAALAATSATFNLLGGFHHGFPDTGGGFCPFNDVAVATINACRAQQGEAALSLDAMRAAGLVEYFPMPADLARKYQSFTEADLSLLRRSGYAAPFAGVAEGVVRYVDHLARAA